MKKVILLLTLLLLIDCQKSLPARGLLFTQDKLSPNQTTLDNLENPYILRYQEDEEFVTKSYLIEDQATQMFLELNNDLHSTVTARINPDIFQGIKYMYPLYQSDENIIIGQPMDFLLPVLGGHIHFEPKHSDTMIEIITSDIVLEGFNHNNDHKNSSRSRAVFVTY